MSAAGNASAEEFACEVVELLVSSGRSLGIAESCTAGALSAVIAAAQGAGECFRGALVAYDASVKYDLLSVSPGPVVTERAAREMAVGIRRLLASDVGLATTGVLGPSAAEGQPVGTLWVGASWGDRTHAHLDRLPVGGGRCDPEEANRAALCRLREWLVSELQAS